MHRLSLAEHYDIDREQTQHVSKTLAILYQQWAKQNLKLVNPQTQSTT
ncbi:MAG: hypothetical protein AB8W37_08520 [Arsenophonus endosymbiont of Dermacentor nuttalli]